MNYSAFRKLYSMYRPMGLQILAFPCNQFGEQEPDEASKVLEWSRNKYHARFPILEKIDVTGEDADPLFQWLQEQDGCEEIEWNFDKFLVDWEGNVVKQQLSGDDPMDLIDDIQTLHDKWIQKQNDIVS